MYSYRMSVLVCAVGYIVGLGDRHINNILIDRQTAELVHIDLGRSVISFQFARNDSCHSFSSPPGVAFEQGKTLPHAELVPFRLTRDMIDGMGLEGVEGVFLRCCEETLRVMRLSQETLLTIVEVRTASSQIDSLFFQPGSGTGFTS